MAQSRVFTIIGDSNVKRNISKTNSRACPLMAGAQILQCGNLQLLEESLRAIRKESDVCIVSCLTNFLTASEDDPMVSKRIEPVLDEFCSALFGASSALPGITFLIAPPMYRRSPVWYREGLPEVLTKFSTFMKEKPASMLLLPSFPTPDYEQDGIHLTAYSGLEFMIHLFDSSLAALTSQTSSCDERIPESTEATRVLEDRVMVLEQDHRRLNSVVELKTASDAELADFHENTRNASFITISNCERILGQSTKDWQERAKKEVSPILKELMGREIPGSRPILRIIPAQDATNRRVQTFNFIEAVKKFPTNFSKSDLDFILSKVGYKQKGQLRALFVCLSDDMLDKFQRSSRSNRDKETPMGQDSAADQVAAPPAPQAPPPVPTTSSRGSHRSSGSGSGSSSSRSESRTQTRSDKGSQKRGASPPSPQDAQPEKSSRV